MDKSFYRETTPEDFPEFPIKAEVLKIGAWILRRDGSFEIDGWKFGSCFCAFDLRDMRNMKFMGYTISELKEIAIMNAK